MSAIRTREGLGEPARRVDKTEQDVCDRAAACLAAEPCLDDRRDSIGPRHRDRCAARDDDDNARLNLEHGLDRVDRARRQTRDLAGHRPPSRNFREGRRTRSPARLAGHRSSLVEQGRGRLVVGRSVPRCEPDRRAPAARRRRISSYAQSTVSGSTWALPPPWNRGTRAMSPMIAMDASGATGRSPPSFLSRTTESAAARRASRW